MMVLTEKPFGRGDNEAVLPRRAHGAADVAQHGGVRGAL